MNFFRHSFEENHMTWNPSGTAGLFVCALLFCHPSSIGSGQARKTRLFDGKSFEGWEGDVQKTFRIQDSAVVGGSLSAKVPRNEFLCTRTSYKNFVLRVQFKLLGTGANAGVQIRSKRIPNHHEVIGYQADMGDPEWWGCLYDESRRKKVLAKADLAAVNKVLKRNDWNEYVIRCEGKRIQLSINGLQTVDYIEPEDSIEQDGVICLQIHGGPPSEAWYKDVSIEELP
jgi:3-keto-disaccharide hydrolase